MLIMNKGPEDEKSFSDEGDEDDSHARTGSRDIVLELDDDNLPLIPEYNNQVLAVRKEIIRKYVTGHYSKSLLSMKDRCLQHADHTHQGITPTMSMQWCLGRTSP